MRGRAASKSSCHGQPSADRRSVVLSPHFSSIPRERNEIADETEWL
jgi:hypothetical protein